ncbi:hypothetical protein [Flavobacterium sp.]|uniref:hypothetical protein n=1 Tax=Flavobacterium sp. TaxID=239 RepID=UPI003752A659
MISKLKYEYLLSIIAISWIIFFSYTIQLTPYFSVYGDDGSYLYSAKSLYYDFKVDSSRPLLISAIHGLPFLFGFSILNVIKWGFFLNFCSWIFTVLLLFKIISKKINRKVAFVFSLFFVFCIGNLAIAFNFLSESIFIFLILISIYLLLQFYDSGRYYYITLSIAFLALNSLIKPISIGLVVVLLIFYIRNIKLIFINKYSWVILFSFFLVFFQMNSLKKSHGDYTLSYIGSITYYNYLGTKANCYKKNIEFNPGTNERAKSIRQKSSHEIKKIAEEDLKNQIINNKFNLLKAYLFCIYSNSTKGSYIVSQTKNKKETMYFDLFYYSFKAISKLQNILFTFLAVVLSFYYLIKVRKEKYFTVISVFILYIFFISAMSCLQCDRFHIAFFPLLLILITKFISDKTKRFSEPLQK